MKTFRTISLALHACFAVLLAFAAPLQANQTINFDTLPAGDQAPNFLAAYGIPTVTFGGTGAGARGPRIYDFTGGNSIVPSPPNILIQDAASLDANQTHVLTFIFSPELTAFSMDRVGKNGFGSTDTWHADFYNASGTFLGSFGEPSPQVDAPVQTFSFTAPPGQTIARMELVSVWTNFATHRNIPVDNFVLTQVPVGPVMVITDSFSLNGTNRTVGVALNGLSTETGGVLWSGRNAFEFTPSGTVVVGTPPQSGGVPTRIISVPFVPTAGDVVTVQGDIQPPYLNNEGPGVWGSIGFCLDPSAYFDLGFYNRNPSNQGLGQLWMALGKDGSWTVLADAVAITIASGPGGSAPNFHVNELNQLRLTYDGTANTVTAAINGVNVLTNHSLTAHGFTPNIQRAGFMFHRTDGGAFDNFSIQTGAQTDTTTLAPTLTSPFASTVYGHSIGVSFSLPENAQPGSVKLLLSHDGGRELTLSITQAGLHSFILDPANPDASPFVIANGTLPIPDGVGSFTISYKDAFGNPAASSTQTDILIDTTEPVLTVPDDIVVYTNDPSGEVVDFSVTADDNFPTGLTVNSVPPSGSTFTVGTTTVYVWAFDSAGNFSNDNFDVTVVLNDHDSVATKGGDVPAAGVDSRIPAAALWTSFGPPAVNEAGNIAFLGKWKAGRVSGTGIFVNDVLVVKVGEAVPGAGLNGLPVDAKFKSFKDPVLNGDGRLAFVGAISGTGVTSLNDTVVISDGLDAGSSTLQIVAREGDVAPQTGGATLKSIAGVAVTGSESEGGAGLVLQGLLTQGTGAPVVTSANDLAAWIGSGTVTLSLAVREGFAVTGLAPDETVKAFKLLVAVSGSPGQGRAFAFGDSPSFSATLSSNRQVLLNAAGGLAEAFLFSGDTLGGTTLPLAKWKSFGPLATAIDGLAVRGVLQSKVGGVVSAQATGIFVGNLDANAWEPVVRVKDLAPGFLDGETFGSLKDPVLAYEGGALAFHAGLKGTGVSSVNDATLWWRPSGGSLTLLAREGESAPGGGFWKAFTSLAMPSGDTGPVFVASLTRDLDGVNAANDLGVWAADSNGSLRLLFREGGSFDGKLLKSFSVLKAVSGSPGVTRAFNSQRELVWRAAFDDGSTEIVVTELP